MPSPYHDITSNRHASNKLNNKTQVPICCWKQIVVTLWGVTDEMVKLVRKGQRCVTMCYFNCTGRIQRVV